MKRFYCVICKKVKRVQKYPTTIIDTTHINPAKRIGSCARHATTQHELYNIVMKGAK